ncbi:protein serrate-like [Mya arenaria]|uniref:protein serrate-like n=1 Tax=Mya arenaria TaxID=6604 RepID=UPI0022E5D6E1|nr:protein serrate-like [Mya arenaria]
MTFRHLKKMDLSLSLALLLLGALVASVNGNCSPDPCIHGTCTDTGSGFACTCDSGYTGPTCSTTLDHCAGNPCNTGAKCYNVKGAALCIGKAVDYCSPNPCANGATCVSGQTTFSCICPADKAGTYCEFPAGDVLDLTTVFVEGSIEYWADVPFSNVVDNDVNTEAWAYSSPDSFMNIFMGKTFPIHHVEFSTEYSWYFGEVVVEVDGVECARQNETFDTNVMTCGELLFGEKVTFTNYANPYFLMSEVYLFSA